MIIPGFDREIHGVPRAHVVFSASQFEQATSALLSVHMATAVDTNAVAE
jgi:hypothetical protein